MRTAVIAALVGALVPLLVGLWWRSSENWLKRQLERPREPDLVAAQPVSVSIERTGPEGDGETACYEGEVRNGSSVPIFDVEVRLVHDGSTLASRSLGVVRRDGSEDFRLERVRAPDTPHVEVEFSAGSDRWRRVGGQLEIVLTPDERSELLPVPVPSISGVASLEAPLRLPLSGSPRG